MQKHVPIHHEHIPLVRRVLAASDEPDLREVGRRGQIDSLVDEKITEARVTLWDDRIAAELAGMKRLIAVERM
jgi:hypothetical protein